MDVPFTIEQFLDVFGRYNRAVWPLQVGFYAVAALLIALAVQPSSRGDRWIGGLLAGVRSRLSFRMRRDGFGIAGAIMIGYALVLLVVDNAQHEMAREAVLQITGQEELLANNPVIRRAIEVRNPYTDLLNLVQVELLKRSRALGDDTEDAQRHVRELLFMSIGDISAAMQTTG